MALVVFVTTGDLSNAADASTIHSANLIREAFASDFSIILIGKSRNNNYIDSLRSILGELVHSNNLKLIVGGSNTIFKRLFYSLLLHPFCIIRNVYFSPHEKIYIHSRSIYTTFVLSLFPFIFSSSDRIILLHEWHLISRGFAAKILQKHLFSSSFIRHIYISSALKHDFNDLCNHHRSPSFHKVIPDASLTYSQAAHLVSNDKSIDALKVKKLLQLDKKYINFCYAGSSQIGKGLDFVIEAAKQFPYHRFYLFGRFDPNILNNSSNNIFYLGFLPNHLVIYLLPLFDAMLLPNKKQQLYGKSSFGKYTSPLKLFEYMSSGKPIISSDLPSLREILNNSAFYFEPDNFDDFVYAIQRFSSYISSNPDSKDFNLSHLHSTTYSWKSRFKSIITT